MPLDSFQQDSLGVNKPGINPEEKQEKRSFEPDPSATLGVNSSIFNRLDELEILVRQNIQWNELVYQESTRIRRRLSWMAVGNWFRLALWLLPIILGVIFLPPLFRQAQDFYQRTFVEPQKKIEIQFNRAVDTINKLNP